MTNRQLRQQLIQGFSEPKLVAESMRDYYLECYAQQVESISQIQDSINGNQTASSDRLITYQQESLEPVVLKVQEVKEAILSYVTDNEALDPNAVITVNQYLNDTADKITISINDLVHNVSVSADSTRIIAEGFNAVVENTASAASAFFEKLSIISSKPTKVFKDTANGIYSILNDITGSVGNKVSSLCEFTGITTFINSASTISTADIQMANYTGFNPVVGFISGIKIVNDGFYQLALSFAEFVSKACDYVHEYLLKPLGKLTAFIGLKIVDWFKTAFIDPVDYECTDDVLGYFNISNRYIIPVFEQSNATYTKRVWNWLHDNTSNKGCVVQFCGMVEKYYAIEGVASLYHTDKAILCEQFFKPISPAKFKEIVAPYINSYSNHNLTVAETVNMFYDLQNADLGMEKGSSEIDVYNGIWISRTLSGVLGWAGEPALGAESSDLYGEVDTSILLENYPGNASGHYLLLNSFNEVKKAYTAIDAASNTSLELGSYQSDGGELYVPGPQYKISGSISNLDFIQVLCGTTAMGKTNSYLLPNSYNVNIDGVKYLDMCTFDYTHEQDLFYQCSRGGAGCLAFPLMYLNAYYNRIDSSGQYVHRNTAGAWLPYSSNLSYNFNMNVSVKTDAQNYETVANCLVKLIVTTAVAIVAVKTAKLFFKGLKTYRMSIALSDAALYNYGDALTSGDFVAAEEYYKQYKRSKIQSYWMSSLYGSFSVYAQDSQMESDQFFSAKMNNQEIIDLIKN